MTFIAVSWVNQSGTLTILEERMCRCIPQMKRRFYVVRISRAIVMSSGAGILPKARLICAHFAITDIYTRPKMGIGRHIVISLLIKLFVSRTDQPSMLLTGISSVLDRDRRPTEHAKDG